MNSHNKSRPIRSFVSSCNPVLNSWYTSPPVDLTGSVPPPFCGFDWQCTPSPVDWTGSALSTGLLLVIRSEGLVCYRDNELFQCNGSFCSQYVKPSVYVLTKACRCTALMHYWLLKTVFLVKKVLKSISIVQLQGKTFSNECWAIICSQESHLLSNAKAITRIMVFCSSKTNTLFGSCKSDLDEESWYYDAL